MDVGLVEVVASGAGEVVVVSLEAEVVEALLGVGGGVAGGVVVLIPVGVASSAIAAVVPSGTIPSTRARPAAVPILTTRVLLDPTDTPPNRVIYAPLEAL